MKATKIWQMVIIMLAALYVIAFFIGELGALEYVCDALVGAFIIGLIIEDWSE